MATGRHPFSVLPWVVGCVVWMLGVNFSQADPADAPRQQRPFAIQVVDAETGRGVPMVQLRTVNDIRYWTDSAGWIAFDTPGLMDREVFFHVSAHGYRYPADGFGYRGVQLVTAAGGSAKIEIQRTNIAQRIYRITGQGIYGHSMTLGLPTPLKHPVLNGRVVGQDTVQVSPHRGRVYWFWGDTNRPSYPLGQFKTSGATSDLPDSGGLSPDVGIDLQYFVDAQGFSRPMAPFEGPGAIWLHGLFALRSAEDGERLLAHYMRIKELGKPLEHGVAVFDDDSQTFEKLVRFDERALLFPRGQSLSYENGTDDYIYFCSPFPTVRVRADIADIQDPTAYEAYTCLKQGSRLDLDVPVDADTQDAAAASRSVSIRPDSIPPSIDVDRSGKVVWSWKRNTDALDALKQKQLVESGYLASHDALLTLYDEVKQRTVYLHAGSVHWNPFRRRWIMIAEEFGGEASFLGEVWYAESDRLEGPWQNARHIVSHDRYSFYNPAHHRFFDQDNGRVVYFEGTYADTFSAAPAPTPQYNYNQIMYRLDLADPRMKLPPRPAK